MGQEKCQKEKVIALKHGSVRIVAKDGWTVRQASPVAANQGPKVNEDTLPVGQLWLSAKPRLVRPQRERKRLQSGLVGRKSVSKA